MAKLVSTSEFGDKLYVTGDDGTDVFAYMVTAEGRRGPEQPLLAILAHYPYFEVPDEVFTSRSVR